MDRNTKWTFAQGLRKIMDYVEEFLNTASHLEVSGDRASADID